MPDPFSRLTPDREVLESWKEIAAYLGRSVRAVQLWEKEESLPVHRHQHDKQGTVFAYRDELDRWRESRSTPPPSPAAPALIFDASARQGTSERSTVGWRRVLEFAGAIALTAVVIGTIAGVVPQRRGTTNSVDIESLAVLPFIHEEGVGEHVSDGLTEMLIDELATTPGLRVMARSAVFEYKGKSVTPTHAGKELNVSAVVTGNVRRTGDAYVVRAELIDTRDGAQLWAGRYDATPAELAFVQRRIVVDLSSRLRGGARPAFAAQKYSTNAEAYEQYLLGLREWNRRVGNGTRNKQALDASVRHFQRAIELDPKFAAAHAGLANAYGVLVGYGELSPSEGTIKVLASARKALELDPNNAEAYTSIATTSFNNLWDFEGAEEAWRRAIALNPNYATAHQWYGASLQELGRFAEARREIDLAYSLDPLSLPITSTRCWSFYYERRYQDAIAFARAIAARDPSRAVPRCEASAMRAMGDLDAWIDEATKRKMPFASSAISTYRSRGARGFYEERLQALLHGARDPRSNALSIARFYAILGKPDQAFAWLETAFQRRDSQLTEFHLHHEFDAIRSDPRFADLARRIGLPPAALAASRELAGKVPSPGLGVEERTQ